MTMRLTVLTLFVNDQDQALRFYIYLNEDPR